MALFESKYTISLLCLIIVGENVAGTTQPVTPLHFTELAQNAGLRSEQYEITTEDGYILDLFHVPGNSNHPVLLVSGTYGTADDYILRGNISLPAVLANAGYDVWAGNVRGCRYGRRHVYLDPDLDAQFWDFSFHEYAVYDTAAMIDFVLYTTQQPQLSSVGFSLGTTLFYILGGERPEYVDKVKVMISFAPIYYVHNSPLLSAIRVPASILNLFVSPTAEVFGENSIEKIALRNTCSIPALAYTVCWHTMFLLFGFNYDEIEREYVPVLFQHYPSSVSGKTLSHLRQVLEQKRLALYDYGLIENIRRYGILRPREYNLYKNNMKVVLISGKNDPLSTLADVELLKGELPNIVDHIILEPESFTHLDFVHGKSAHQVLHKPIVLEILKTYN